MARRVHQAVAPAYLLLCLILGGSAQGIWANMALQLLGIAILTWAAIAPAEEPLPAPARQLLMIAIAAVLIVAAQLIPLPGSLWANLGGRAAIADGYRVLGVPLPTLPLSLTPYGSLDSLLGVIPPLALFCSIVRLKAYRPSWLVAALLAGTVAGILLGALQVASSDYLASPWYLYRESNFGVAVGFFANGNHMAILLVITLPFLAALLASAQGSDTQRNRAVSAIVLGVTLLIVVGVALNRSLAAYGLSLPVLAASALLLLPHNSSWRRWAVIVAALLLVGGVGALATSSTGGDQQLAQEANTSVQSRQEMLATTARAVRDFMPLGSGLGSFRGVYHLYESREQINDTYVNHAHDDYVELALETGVAGVLLMIASLFWWARAAWRAWRDADGGPYARAASIASAAILVHSLVDFPLRTAAISAAFAMCLALLAERQIRVARDKSDLWPTRHVVLR